MFNPHKLYRKSQDIQWQWIRNHPVEYVALNATILAGFFGYTKYQDRKFHRKVKANCDSLIQQD
jgi:hypothetical protein